MADSAVPVTNTRPKCRLVHTPMNKTEKEIPDPAHTTLTFLCRAVIVANLERYPPLAFSLCCEEEWNELVRLKHKKSAPKEGRGGLDGTGRMAPALSDKFLCDVEEENRHLADSQVVDELVWKDCVEYRFRRGGLTRPRALLLPWPLLVESLRQASEQLKECVDRESIMNAIETLVKAPMNVSLMKASGVGKAIRKIVKNRNNNLIADEEFSQLQELLESWKVLAANSGVAMDKDTPVKKSALVRRYEEDEEDLNDVASCQDWRHIFAVLKRREETRRSSQGKRMREIRRNLASDRPKVVKVRPSSAKHARILTHPADRKAGPTNVKIAQIRQEATIVSSRQKSPPPTSAKRSAFGDAVAFATVAKRRSRSLPAARAPTSTVSLSGGKMMHVPSKVVQGGGPRQLGSKYKRY